MPKSYSPLRYPGGKSSIAPFISNVINLNQFNLYSYVEPYAGGAGLALKLMFDGYVSDIYLNDIDPSIWSFWHILLEFPDEFIGMINDTNVTVDEWYKQREIHIKQDISDPLSLGFSTFFLNRVNRSGIISRAGVIGGLNQEGNYKIDCRFNKETLIKRINRIKLYKSRIYLSKLDAVKFMKKTSFPDNSFFCIDPPYYKKGSVLYSSFYLPSDHEEVSRIIGNLNQPWIVTYDNEPSIRRLYKNYRQFTFDIYYSVHTKRTGKELLVPSKGLKIPQDIRSRQITPIRGYAIL
ncbi:MAG: DNA adenine methylase [Parvularculales bacterium]